jgi:anti-sigma factor RsiW
MTFCFQFVRRLAPYLDGVLNPDEERRVAEHLRSCAPCHEHAERIHRDIDLLQTLPLEEPPDHTWRSIEEELSTFVPSTTVALPKVRPKLLGLIPQRLAIAAVLFVLVLGIFSVTRRDPKFGGRHSELNLAGYLDLVGAATAAAADSKPNDFPPAPGFLDVTIADAKATLDFPIISPQSLPDGYSLTAVRLYTRDNVRAVQLQYQNEQGALCLFQMPTTVQPSFGNQQSEADTVGGVQCHRTRSSRCVAYRFVLGQTGYVLMMRQRDPELTDRLIKEIRAAYEKTVGMR